MLKLHHDELAFDTDLLMSSWRAFKKLKNEEIFEKPKYIERQKYFIYNIDYFLNKINDLSIEICGNFILSSQNELIIDKIYLGQTGLNRGLCQAEKYLHYIYHTHAKYMKAYPSVEDV